MTLNFRKVVGGPAFRAADLADALCEAYGFSPDELLDWLSRLQRPCYWARPAGVVIETEFSRAQTEYLKYWRSQARETLFDILPRLAPDMLTALTAPSDGTSRVYDRWLTAVEVGGLHALSHLLDADEAGCTAMTRLAVFKQLDAEAFADGGPELFAVLEKSARPGADITAWVLELYDHVLQCAAWDVALGAESATASSRQAGAGSDSANAENRRAGDDGRCEI